MSQPRLGEATAWGDTPRIKRFPGTTLASKEAFGLFHHLFKYDFALPQTLPEFDGKTRIEMVCRDAAYLAYLCGCLAIQDWIEGAGESTIAPAWARRPVVLVTDRLREVADAYLSLYISLDGVRELCRARQLALLERYNRVPDYVAQKATYWKDHLVKRQRMGYQLDGEFRLHNLFPAEAQHGGKLHLIHTRDHFGMADREGPALVLIGATDEVPEGTYQSSAVYLCDMRSEVKLEHTPDLRTHCSVFASSLPRSQIKAATIGCFPDRRFEELAKRSQARLVNVPIEQSAADSLQELDAALFACHLRAYQTKEPVFHAIVRCGHHLRTLLLGLVVPPTAWDTALILTRLPENEKFSNRIQDQKQALASRLVEARAFSNRDGDIVERMLNAVEELHNIAEQVQPKRDALQALLNELDDEQAVVLVTGHRSTASILRSITSLGDELPDTWRLNFGRPLDVIDLSQLASIDRNTTVVILQDTPAEQLFNELVECEPKNVFFLLVDNEMRFSTSAVPIRRARDLFADQPYVRSLVSPLIEHVDRCTPAKYLPQIKDMFGEAVDEEMEAEVERLRHRLVRPQLGRVLTDASDNGNDEGEEIEARLVQLDQGRAVYLSSAKKPTILRGRQILCTDEILPGDYLIMVCPTERSRIAGLLLDASREERLSTDSGSVVQTWKEELRRARRLSSLSNHQLLEEMQQHGCKRINPSIVTNWMTTELGPQDEEDIRRVGMVLKSEWILKNWAEVAAVIKAIRSSQRKLGQHVTEIIAAVATGTRALKTSDKKVLNGIGLTEEDIEQAVTSVRVEQVAPSTETISIEHLNTVFENQGA